MRRGDFYNTKPRFYRRRNRVTTLWGNGVWSGGGVYNLMTVSLFYGLGVLVGGGAWWELLDIWQRTGEWQGGFVISGIIGLPLFLLSARYLIRVWGLWVICLFTLAGRRLMMFNSRRIWVKGLTPRFGSPWSEVEVHFLRKFYYLSHRPALCYGLKTKIFVNGRCKKLREWDVWLLTGRDLQTLLLYELWRYRDRTGDKRWQLGRKAYGDDRPEIPYPEGID